ncbi:MAG TPA: radical SAM protein [Ruminiclostridium sp.]|nr:radical SAM protein [Ruminiclostridium sp.]
MDINSKVRLSPPKLRGYSYSLEETVKARNENRLLCLRLDTNYNCNLQCAYCYSYLKHDSENPLSMKIGDAKNIIDQASELGLKSIVYLGGGEPTLYPNFWELVEHMGKKDIIPVIFTNGLTMNDEYAKRLYDLGASIIVKFDGSEETQDKLTGEGTYKKIRSAMETLVKYGFNENRGDNVTRLGAAPCICNVNYNEIPEMWRFLRKNFIFPDFERATSIGNATDSIAINEEQVQKLLETLRSVDENEFNFSWQTPYSAIPGHNCYIYLSGCHITADKFVALCPEMPPVGNLSESSLKQILTSEPFCSTRHIEKNIEGPCKDCDILLQCFGGCRSKAYYTHDSYLASDPFCPYIKELALSGKD